MKKTISSKLNTLAAFKMVERELKKIKGGAKLLDRGEAGDNVGLLPVNQPIKGK